MVEKVYTYRTAARRVNRSTRVLRKWRSKFGMPVTIDPESGEVLILEADLLEALRTSLHRDQRHVKEMRERAAELAESDPTGAKLIAKSYGAPIRRCPCCGQVVGPRALARMEAGA